MVTVRVNHSVQEQRQPWLECPVELEEENTLHSAGEALPNLLAWFMCSMSLYVVFEMLLVYVRTKLRLHRHPFLDERQRPADHWKFQDTMRLVFCSSQQQRL